MPIYRAKLLGRNKALLIKAEGLHEARAQLVTLDALKADEMATALEAGESIWKPGEELPEDEKPADPAVGDGDGGTAA